MKFTYKCIQGSVYIFYVLLITVSIYGLKTWPCGSTSFSTLRKNVGIINTPGMRQRSYKTQSNLI